MNNELLARNSLQQAFPGIPDREADQLLSSGEVVQYMPGKVLCKEGEVEDVFYILLAGKVKVSKRISDQEERFLKHLVPGDFFGEMAILHHAQRAASVTTTENSTVLEINKESFENALEKSSSLAIAMVREVSRRLRENDEMAIQELRVKASELAQAYQKLAEQELARREFLTTIAHELRTPLTTASGYIQIINSGMMDEAAQKSALETVGKNLDQITGLTNDIMFLQEMELILSDFEPLELGAVLDAVVEAERSYAAENGVALSLSIGQEIPLFLGDEKSLKRALGAIVNNAIKFSPDGGDVSIVVDHNPTHLWVRVTVQGVGIQQEDLDNIFERFFRLEEFDGHLFGGVGLGLSIAQQVIIQHRGTIDVQSQLRQGSVFSILLNLALIPSQPVAAQVSS
ncbi:MAG: cyclic nucleotide-binding domain-containing protein [Chloroflexota bacterium]